MAHSNHNKSRHEDRFDRMPHVAYAKRKLVGELRLIGKTRRVKRHDLGDQLFDVHETVAA